MRVLLATAALLFVSADAHAIRGGAVVPISEGATAVHFTARGRGVRGQCSGVLVAPTKVLTAAHCVRDHRGRKRAVRSVRLGNPAGKTIRARVASVHVHPDYDPKRPAGGSDLAVLVLAKAVKNIAPIPIATAADDPGAGDKVMVRGFGLTPRGRRLVPSTRTLRGVKLETLSPFACFSGPVKTMARTRMCASAVSAGVCPGDSGAGVTRTVDGSEVVVGVVSVVLDAGRCHRGPTIMGRTSAFATWVDEI